MSNLWVHAVKPRSTGRVPVETGLFYRLHPKDRPFGPEHATSQPFHQPEDLHYSEFDDDEDMQTAREFFAPRSGLSAYAEPHHLHQYVEQRGLQTHNADVVAFHGTQVGYGHDDEPLVMPHHDKPFQRIPYDDFARRMRRTPKPAHPLDLDEDDGADWFGGGH